MGCLGLQKVCLDIPLQREIFYSFIHNNLLRVNIFLSMY